MPQTYMPRRSGGSDWRTIHVMRIDQETGESERLSDKLENVKFSSMAWTHDNKACNKAAAWRLSAARTACVIYKLAASHAWVP